MADWYTAQSAKSVDKNLDTVPNGILELIVTTARNQVLSLPPLPAVAIPGVEPVELEPGKIPEHWALGHLMQIQALAKASKTGPGDVMGPDGYTVRVYPMDWNIKAVLRPSSTSPDSLVG